MASDESLLEISRIPNPFFHVFTFEGMLSLLDKFISSHLNVLIEKVAPENLFSVFVIEHLGVEECVTHYCLGNKLEILIVEEHVIVV